MRPFLCAALALAFGACATDPADDETDAKAPAVADATSGADESPSPAPPPANDPPPLTGRSLGVADLAVVPAGGGSRLAAVGDDAITTDDLCSVLFLSQTEMVFAALEQAIQRRLLLKEADRHGITVRDHALADEVDRVLQQQDDEFKLSAGPGADFEQFIESRYGTSASTYRGAVEKRVLEELLLARLVRYQARQRDRIELRMIVVDDRALADEIVEKLGQGANFAALAKQHSMDASSEAGGLYPPVPADVQNPVLAGVESLAVGQSSDVVAFQREGKAYYRVLKLERRHPADRRPFAAQESTIASELDERPLQLLEILEWEARMRAEYPIEVFLGQGPAAG